MPHKGTVAGQGTNLDHGWKGEFDDARLDTPTFHRNHGPIAEVLQRYMSRRITGMALEIGSGSGQHVIGFASNFPKLTWHPSDPDPRHRESISAWITSTATRNVVAPVALDASTNDWVLPDAQPAQVIISINVLHIAPWTVTEGILAGAGRQLSPGGHLFLYGPFKRNGSHTADSNAAFDATLRARDPRWGIRDLTDIESLAARHDLVVGDHAEMPANNLTLVFRRQT